jgi:molecular chaperone GrpE
MPAPETGGVPEERGGPVIHDHRRIDPVTGQPRRGKHAASKPAGTSGAGRPGGTGSFSAMGGDGRPNADQQGDPEPASGGQHEAAGPQPAGQHAAEEAGHQDDHGPAGSEEGVPPSQQSQDDVLSGGVVPPGQGDQQAPQAQPQASGTAASDLKAQLAERTADLQRLQAEYANYRKRVDRDRAAVKEQAVAGALTGLIPVLDAIDRAREHGELTGGFKSVADQLNAALSRLGLVTYGEKGDPFDPKIHEALTHTYSPDVTENTCVDILQPGYQVGERILRPARVAVAEPATGPDGSGNEASWPSPDEEGN